MTLRGIACRTALVAGLSLAVAPAFGCDGTDCASAAKTKSPSKPLRLDQFMRHPATTATAGAAKVRKATKTHAAAAPRHRHRVAAKPDPLTLPVEAAKAFAAQPDANVRVVASDELNEIDLAAAVPSETGAVVAASQNVLVVDAGELNDIDRLADQPRAASPDSVATPRNPTVGGETASQTWTQRLWTMLYGAWAAPRLTPEP